MSRPCPDWLAPMLASCTGAISTCKIQPLTVNGKDII